MRSKSVKGSTTPTKTQQVIYRCTGCQEIIKSHHDAALHPLLDTLICRTCYTKYGNGDFATLWDDGVDELGDDNYCRWCCDGGSLIGCMKGLDEDNERCHYMFCRDCIEHNLPNEPILKAVDSDHITWHCYVCDKSKLKNIRAKAQEAISDLMNREPSLIPDITPKNLVGRAKYRDASATPSTSTATPKSAPCPASKKPQAPAQVDQASSPQDDMDIDVTSLSPSKPTVSSSTSEDDDPVKQKDTADKKKDPEKNGAERDAEKKGIDKRDDSTKVKDYDTSSDKSKDKDREITRKPSITSTKDLYQSSTAGNKESSKKVRENGLSKRDKEARVEGEPIVAPADAVLIHLSGESKLKTKSNIRRASDSFNPANPLKKRRTDSLSTDNLSGKISNSNIKKTPDNDKASASTTKETGLEPQMIYPKTATAPSSTADRQQTTNGTSETQNNRQSVINNKAKHPTNKGRLSLVPTDTPNKIKAGLGDIKKKLECYSKIKQLCIEEMGSKFDKIIDMVSFYSSSSDNNARNSIGSEIGSLRKPLQDFEAMIRDLENLCC